MTETALLFLRGFIQVAPVAASTYFVSHDRQGYAVATGFFISFCWWWNAGSAAHLSGFWWACTYASGAAVGTWAGQAAARALTRRRAVQHPAPFIRAEHQTDVNGNPMTED